MIHRVLVPALLILTLQRCNAQERCIAPPNNPGVCINLRNCQHVVQLLQQKPIPEHVVNYLRSLQCGFEGRIPKVCCETQSAPTPTPTPTQPPETDAVPDPPDVSNHPNIRMINENICGPATTPKIIGGNRTGVFDFPWMALIAYDVGTSSPEFKCGGTLINKRYVLTAAHCVVNLPSGLRLLGARLGEHDLDTERDCDRDENGLEVVCAERYQDFGFENVIAHPEYNPITARNDIAVLRLNGNADFRPQNVRPICLPIGSAAAFTQKKALVTGWGTTDAGIRSQSLLQVKLPIVNTSACAEAYTRKTVIWYKQICAGGKKNMDSCLGDSGGPLQAPATYNNDVKYVQYGIVSFGLQGCAIEGVPGVYTNVIYYLDWILNNLRS